MKLILWLIICVCIGPVAFADKSKSNHASRRAPFVLRVRPSITYVNYGKPVPLRVFIVNTSSRDRLIYFSFYPVHFGADTDMGCLMMRCRNNKTGNDVQYHYKPPGTTVQDALGIKQLTRISAHSFNGVTINLRDWCELPPGQYTVELQYETEKIPGWVVPDSRGWHGRTNEVSVSVVIGNSQTQSKVGK